MFSVLQKTLGSSNRIRTSANNLPRSSNRNLSRVSHDNSSEDKWKVLESPFKQKLRREKVQTKRKVALKIAYTGTGYFGSQKSPDNRPTIEGALEKALYESGMILDTNYGHLDKIGWSRSSRTDKGVHSLCTVVGVRLEGYWTRIDYGDGNYVYDIDGECIPLPEKINEYLPNEIRVLAAAPVVHHWDARKACMVREYEYLIPESVLKDSLYDTDREKFTELLNCFLGRHHWHNYGQIDAKKAPKRPDRNREHDEIQLTEENDIPVDSESIPSAEPIETVETVETIKAEKIHQNMESEEPSLLMSAPSSMNSSKEKSRSSRPTLYALDDYKSETNDYTNEIKPETNDPKSNETTKNTKKDKKLNDENLSTENSSNLDNHTLSNDSAQATDMKSASTPRTSPILNWPTSDFSDPTEIARQPLDLHLSQDAFYRTIHSISHDEVIVEGEKYIRVSMTGDSFLLHQIRRMIGMLIATSKGFFSAEAFFASIDSPFRILTPRAPPTGLLLKNAQFHGLDFKGRDVLPQKQFASQLIYPHLHKKWKAINALSSQFNGTSTRETMDDAIQKENLELLKSNVSEDSTDMVGGIEDDIEVDETLLDSGRIAGWMKDPWSEINSVVPILEIRDIIPGFDQWREWHMQDVIARRERRESKLQQQMSKNAMKETENEDPQERKTPHKRSPSSSSSSSSWGKSMKSQSQRRRKYDNPRQNYSSISHESL